MYIDYDKILRCAEDERIFRKCHARIHYYTLQIPKIGTVYNVDGQNKVTTPGKPFLLLDETQNIQSLSYAELCMRYLLYGAPITVYALVHCCDWHNVSGQLDSENVWGTVYTCDSIQVHTQACEYRVLKLPVGVETRYVPMNVVGRADVMVRSAENDYKYLYYPVVDGVPEIQRMAYTNMLYFYSNFVRDDSDTDDVDVLRVLTNVSDNVV